MMRARDRECAQCGATAEEANDCLLKNCNWPNLPEDDGGDVSEAQEWHDYDPDC